MIAEIYPSKVCGELNPPASKSACHRAIICASLAQGRSEISGLSLSKDIEATLNCMEALGARISLHGRRAQIEGCNPRQIVHPLELHAGESGSTLRFLIPIAASGKEPVTFYGRPSLLVRPMKIYEQLFASQRLPFDASSVKICFHGPLQGSQFSIDGSVSSQFISGLLMAAPLFALESGLDLQVLPPYESQSYTTMTVEMMKVFHVNVVQDGLSYHVPAHQTYQPATLHVPPDYSQVAFFAVLAGLNHELSFNDLHPASCQGDRVILDILQKWGAGISWTSSGTLHIEPGSRKPLTIDLADCPDLGPILCVLAAYTPGRTTFINAGRLRIKECDRIDAMETELRKWGVHITSTTDTITIDGKQEWKMDHMVEIDGHNDHRIVMAMTIFGLCALSPCMIHGAQAVSKSYPDFFEDVLSIEGRVICQ